MPEDFPRIDIAEREDVEHVFEVIKKHANRLVKEELKKDGKDQDTEALMSCQRAIDRVSSDWINGLG